MKIGLTYDLREAYLALGYNEEQTAEFDKSQTIDFLEAAISATGAVVERIGNAKQLIAALNEGKNWDLVFNICEGMYGTARESQVPAILDVYNIPYTFSDTLVTAYCLDKSLTKIILRQHNIATADFFKVLSVQQELSENLKFPLFLKPVAEGTSKGVATNSIVYNSKQLKEVASELLEKFKQAVLVESYLPGREFTVGMLGTGSDARVLGVLEIVLKKNAEQKVYSYKNKENCEELVEYQLVSGLYEVEALALKAWQVLGCRDSGRVDIRYDGEQKPNVIEVNPLSGLHPTHSDLPMLASAVGMTYQELISQILVSAKKRLK